MNCWAEKQARRELVTRQLGMVIGLILVLLFFTVGAARMGVVQRNRIVDVPDAAAAAKAMQEERIARVSYEQSQYLGTITVETNRQSEISFMAGGVVGAVPGAAHTFETDYDLWGLAGSDFDALCFFPAGMEPPENGTLTMDTQIEWLNVDERAQIIREASGGEYLAFVYLYWAEESWRWPLVASLAAITLLAALGMVWLLKSRRALRLTQFWKKLKRAGRAEEIFEDLQDVLYEDSAFAIGRRYVCLPKYVMARAGLTLEEEEGAMRFVAANGQADTYYPEDEAAAAQVRALLK